MLINKSHYVSARATKIRVEIKDVREKNIKISEDIMPFDYEIRVIADNEAGWEIVKRDNKTTWVITLDYKNKKMVIRF